MGWSSGSQLAEYLYDEIRSQIPKANRRNVAAVFIDAFEDHDADDWSEDTNLWVDSGRLVYDPEEDE